MAPACNLTPHWMMNIYCCLDMMRRMRYITNSATMNVKMRARRPMQNTLKTCKLYSLALQSQL